MKEQGEIRILFFTRNGAALAKRIAAGIPGRVCYRYTTKEEIQTEYPGTIRITQGLGTWCGESFQKAEVILFIGAAGIAVRTIAPFLNSKKTDPAVLVADEQGKHVISLLSGHLGGANAWTEQIADIIGADPVITTASDVNGKLAIDVWAKKNHLQISDMKLAKQVAAGIVDGKTITMFCEGEVRGTVPGEIRLIVGGGKGDAPESQLNVRGSQTMENPDVAVSVHTGWAENTLCLIPQSVILGIGCKRGKTVEEIRSSVLGILSRCHISPESIAVMASIDLKADEQGLCDLAAIRQIPFVTFDAETLRNVPGSYEPSEFVAKITGVDNVCERAAVAALPKAEQEHAEYICRKTAENGVTVSLILRKWEVSFE